MIEQRSIKNAGLSVESREGGGTTIVGYAAVFFDQADAGTEYELWPNTFERIAPEAFSRAIAEKQDCRALFNHNPDCILGRVSSGTCRVSVDSRGLRYEIDCPNTQAAKDLCQSIARGDITGSSFSFVAKKRTWIDGENGRETTIVDDCDLFDVGPVVFPAYESTTSSVRSAEVEQSREQWQRERKVANLPQSSPGPKLALLRIKEKQF